MNVLSSGHSIFVTPASLTLGSRYPAPMFAPSLIAAIARPQLKQTSLEVAGVPSENFMPSRMWNVTLSADRCHVSAKPGAGLVSLSKSVSRL
jgi:hypothetical protein